MFNTITGINESYILCQCKSIYHANVNVDLMEENVIQINGGIMINVDTSVKNVMYEEDYFGNPAACNRENGKHSSSIMDD